MKEIKIQKADKQDIDAVMQLMMEAKQKVKDPQWFATDNRDYVEKRVKKHGFILKACQEGKIVGFFVVDIPGREKENLGYDLGYSEEKLEQVVHMDYAVVSKEAQGYGLQKRFVEEAEKRLCKTKYKYFLATVHPDNVYSRRNMVQMGYREAKQLLKYGGMPRIIMEKKKTDGFRF